MVTEPRKLNVRHDHLFGQDRVRPGERRTRLVMLITAAMMIVEIVAGIAYGSMALLADGLHMGSHASALLINAFAYAYARRHAGDHRFAFGTGKVNALGGFSGAILLAVFALFMAYESVHRVLAPVPISFNQAILVAFLGLLVNAVSVFILGGDDEHHHHDHDHDEDHAHGHAHHHSHDHGHSDLNLRSAYLHVLADALTSVTAIIALLAGKYMGWNWLDPVMGIVGSLLVARWSWGLMRSTSAVLLDRQAPPQLLDQLVRSVEGQGDATVTDMHVWSIGPGIYAAELRIVAREPLRPDEYRARLPEELPLMHVTVEVDAAEGP